MSFIYLWEFCISHRLVVYCDSNVFSTRRVYEKTVMFHCQHSAHCSSIHSHVCLRAGCKLKERLSIQARQKQHQRRFGPNADHRSSPMFCCGKLERGRHWLKRHYPNGLCENAWNQINLYVIYTGSETASRMWRRRFWSITTFLCYLKNHIYFYLTSFIF